MLPFLFLLLLPSPLLSSALISLLYTLFFPSSTLSLIVVSLLCFVNKVVSQNKTKKMIKIKIIIILIKIIK